MVEIKELNMSILVKELVLHFQTFGHSSHVFVYNYLELNPPTGGASFSQVGGA